MKKRDITKEYNRIVGREQNDFFSLDPESIAKNFPKVTVLKPTETVYSNNTILTTELAKQ